MEKKSEKRRKKTSERKKEEGETRGREMRLRGEGGGVRRRINHYILKGLKIHNHMHELFNISLPLLLFSF